MEIITAIRNLLLLLLLLSLLNLCQNY